MAAYDDALGVTAAFNLNVLNVANGIAGTNFSVSDWRHVALFNRDQSRIEMHLEARRPVTVRWPGGERRFAAGERIHTENSYKYTLPRLTQLLRDAGYTTVRLTPTRRTVSRSRWRSSRTRPVAASRTSDYDAASRIVA